MILLLGLLYHSYRIYQKWHQVIARHRFFFLWSLLTIITLFGILAAGMYQSYDMNGVQIMVLFMIANFYVIVLQFLWRFDFCSTSGRGHVPKEGSFERAKESLGFNYFDKDTDVEFSRSGSDGRPIADDNSDGEDAKGPSQRPYVPFDDEHEKDGMKPGVFGGENERVVLSREGSTPLDDTGHFEDLKVNTKGGKKAAASFGKDA